MSNSSKILGSSSRKDYAVLWEPVRIGPLVARNRVFLPAHFVGLGYAETGAYLRERAVGGVGTIVTPGCIPHRSGARPGARAWNREWIPEISKVITPPKAAGALVIGQITHPGPNGVRRTDDLREWGPLWAPSAISSPAFKTVPKVMETQDIEELLEGHASVAANFQEAGGDGMEIHAGHGYLLSSFLSPYWNRRTDEYGGDTTRRSRIVRDAAKGIRFRCGPQFIIGVKINLDEYIGATGTTLLEALKVIKALSAEGVIDYYCVAHTDYHSNHYLVPPASSGLDTPLSDGARQVKLSVGSSVIVMLQGGIRYLHTGAEHIRRSNADMIGMVRAQIADPQLVLKARLGKADEIRRCVGANQGCWRRLGQPINCTVNPTTGREAEFGVSASSLSNSPQRVLVVGGGPGGMKCAEAAAMRGHQVSLWEWKSMLGGQLNFASLLPDWGHWADLTQDLDRSLRSLGVDVQLNKIGDIDNIRAYRADAVFIATGSTWDLTGFSSDRPDRQGIARPADFNVLEPISAIASPAQCGQQVLIVDDNGDYTPIGLARLLVALGKQVTIVTSDAMIGRKLEATSDLPWVLPRAIEAGVNIIVNAFVEEIGEREALIRNKWTSSSQTMPVDTAILSMMRQSREMLYHELRAAGVSVRRVGDCVAPREVDDAVLEGFREGALIGDPAMARFI